MPAGANRAATGTTAAGPTSPNASGDRVLSHSSHPTATLSSSRAVTNRARAEMNRPSGLNCKHPRPADAVVRQRVQRVVGAIERKRLDVGADAGAHRLGEEGPRVVAGVVVRAGHDALGVGE